MNIKLRKRHLYLWMAIGIALPLLCLTAIEHIPKNVIGDIPQKATPDTGPDVFLIEVSTQDSSLLISIDVVRPPVSAFTLAHLGAGEEAQGPSLLLGGLNEMDRYEFVVDRREAESYDHIVITDMLNNTIIHRSSIKSLKP